MNIILVNLSYPPDSVGGTEVYTHRLARSLMAAGHSVTVFTALDDDARSRYSVTHSEYDGVPVRRVTNAPKHAHSFEESFSDLEVNWAFREALWDIEPDLVHFQHLAYLSAGLPEVAHEEGVPTICTLHDYWYMCFRSHLLRPGQGICSGPNGGNHCATCFDASVQHGLSKTAMVEQHTARYEFFRRQLAFSDAILSPSVHLKDRYEAAGFSGISVLPLGIAAAEHAQAPLFTGKVQLAFIGNLIRSKGALVAIRELLPLALRGVVELHVHGSGRDVELLGEIESFASQYPPGSIKLHGAYEPAALDTILASVHATIFPSLWEENYPLVTREALRRGVPVIASRLGGVTEVIVDGVNGFLFDPYCAGDLARRVESLVADPQLLVKLRDGARQTVIETECHHVESLTQLYQTVINEHRAGPLDLPITPTHESGTRDFTNTPVAKQRPHAKFAPVNIAQSPLVSIITPFYNTGEIFRETAESIRRQTMQQWEWIIVNDGSTKPASLALLEEFRNIDSRIRVVDHTKNRGLSAARNSGFAAAGTEYVVQIDSDDLLEATAVEKWWWYLRCHPDAGFVKGYSISFAAETYEWTKGFHHGRAFLEENLVNASCMIRRSTHHAVGGYDESMKAGLEDWDFWLRCANAGYWGYCIPEFLDWYRRRVDHSARWGALTADRLETFRQSSREKYPRLWKEGFPSTGPFGATSVLPPGDQLLPENRLPTDCRRVMILSDALTLDGEKLAAIAREVVASGAELTVVFLTPNAALRNIEEITSDVYVLSSILPPIAHPAFLQYLVTSRGTDLVLTTEMRWGWTCGSWLKHQHSNLNILHVDARDAAEIDLIDTGAAIRHIPILVNTIVATIAAQNELLRRGMDAERVQVCYALNAVRPLIAGDRTRIRSDLQIHDDAIVIANADRIDAESQPFVFARSLLKLRALSDSWVAMVLGEGPELDWLYGFVVQYDLAKHVRIVPTVLGNPRFELLAAADIYFQATQRSGAEPHTLEALRRGLPIVGEDTAKLTALLSPDACSLVPRTREDVREDAYAGALLQLIASSARRKSMGVAATKVAARQLSTAALRHCIQPALNAAYTSLDVASASNGNSATSEDVVAVGRSLLEMNDRRSRSTVALSDDGLDKRPKWNQLIRKHQVLLRRQRLLSNQASARLIHVVNGQAQQRELESQFQEYESRLALEIRQHTDTVEQLAQVESLAADLLQRANVHLELANKRQGYIEGLGRTKWVWLGRFLGLLRL